MDALGETGFEFWIGVWNCTFEGGHAINTIAREFDGHVLVERFTMDSPRTWRGTSLSVFTPANGLWRQTWVDDSGNYWNFVGGHVDGHPAFATPEPVDADQRHKRMVFSDITPDAFHWRWESSPDGASWTVNWAIDYSRRDEAA